MADEADPICWLHLSDFHTGHDKSGQRRMFKDLLEHIRHRIEDDEVYPDMVFITGDIADKGKSDEYRMFFDEFFLEMVALLSHELYANIFLIPGNHDVNRHEKDRLWLRQYLSEFPEALDPDENGRRLRSDLSERFREYIAAKDLHDCTPINGEWLRSEAGAYVYKLPVKYDNTRKIGILGLNTAWLSGEGSDHQNLTPGKLIVATGLDRLDDCFVKIVLGHHQIDWFTLKELEPIRSRFAKSGVIYLHGDQHKSRVRLEEASGQQFLTIESGAAFQGRDDEVWVNRLLWCKLYPDEQIIHIHPRIWSTANQEWGLDSSLPETKRVKGTDYWEYTLPNAQKQGYTKSVSNVQARKRRDFSKVPFKGWKYVNQGFLERRKDTLSGEEALMYFDGGDVTWDVALSSRVPRRGIVRDIYKAVTTARRVPPDITVLLGGGGEGKSTALLQVASDLLLEQHTWTMLWQEKPGLPLPTEFWNSEPLKEGDWLVVVDEADLIIQDIYEAVKNLPAERRKHFHFLLCCRDTDWRSAGADTLPWNRDGLVKVPGGEPLAGITEEDAALIIRAWRECQEDGSGLGKLQGMSELEAIHKFVDMARAEAAKKDGNGAFLGAMLQIRFGNNLQNHVLSLLNSLSQKRLSQPHEDKTLLNAFAYIAAVHAEEITILTEDILAKCLDIDLEREIGYIHRHVLSLLGKEVGTTLRRGVDFEHRWPTILTRHKIIAETAVKVLKDNFYFETAVWTAMFKKLVRSAIAIYEARLAYVPELKIWRQLPVHFAYQRGRGGLFSEERERKDFAIELAEMLVGMDAADPLYVTQLAELYTDEQFHDLSVRTFRKGAGKIPEAKRDKIYYHDWAKAEGKAAHFAMSAWLDGIALADSTPSPSRKDNYTRDGYAMMFLHGLSMSFKELALLHPEKEEIFLLAWIAAVQLGLMLKGNYMTADTRKSLQAALSEMRNQGIGQVELARALQDIGNGVIAAWELREDTSLYTLREGSALTFTRLVEMLA